MSTTTAQLPELRPVAQRCENATRHFVGLCADLGFAEGDALKILSVYKKAKAVKLNSAMGRYDFTHGAFVDVEVMRRALEA